jgi:general secretion pathway protein L
MSRFAKPIALALSLAPRARVLNLRKGSLAYEGGYGFLRDKVPLLSALGAVIVVSFVFATSAELWSLGREKKTLEVALSTVTQDVFADPTSDPARALELLDKNTVAADEDPLPHADAFDLLVQLSQTIPESMKHDIEELDVQRAKATVHGIVATIPDAQQIATTLKNTKCFQDVKIVRTNQVVGEDRQKYTLELDIKCPQENKDKGAGPAGSASAAAQGSKP